MRLGVQGFGPDRIRVNLQSLVPEFLLVRIPGGSLFRPSLVINAGKRVNRVQEMITLGEERISLGPKKFATRDLAAACVELWGRVPLPRDVLAYLPGKKLPGAASLFPLLAERRLPWEGWQAALWILTDDATFKEMNRSRPHRPGEPQARPIPPLLFAAAMMVVEEAGFPLERKRCWKDKWVLARAARPCLYPPWARSLSRWALGKLHALGHQGTYGRAVLDVLEKDRDPLLGLEAFKEAARSPGPGTLAAMRAFLARFPDPPSEPGFSPRRVYMILSRGRAGAWAVPPRGGGPPPSSRDGLDRLLAEIRGFGPEAERDLGILAKMGGTLKDPRARAAVGRALASYLKGEFPLADTSLVQAVAAFRDTWSLGGLLRVLDRRKKALPATRRVWVRLVSLYPEGRATKWLLDKLSDPDRGVRAEAVRALRKRPGAAGALLSLAGRAGTPALRLEALDALASPAGARNPSLRRAVLGFLQDPSYRVREKALGLLLFWKCREYLPQALTLCAQDPSQRVRWAAAKALRRLGDAATARKIRALLDGGAGHSRELRWALAGIRSGR